MASYTEIRTVSLLRVRNYYSLLYLFELQELQEQASQVAAMLEAWEP